MGELYVAQKNKKAALESYEKSIELASIVAKEFEKNVEVMKILLNASVKKIKLDNNIAEKDISLERIIESAENLYKEVPSKTSAQLLAERDVYVE